MFLERSSEHKHTEKGDLPKPLKAVSNGVRGGAVRDIALGLLLFARELYPTAPIPSVFRNRLVVVDANVLLSDLGYGARHGRKTTLLGEAEMGFVKVLTTPRILAEVEQNLDEYVKNRGADPEAARSLWGEYKSHLSVFEPPAVYTERAGRVAHRDPDDLPTAHIIEVLQPSLALSRDKDLAESGLISPGDWLNLLLELNNASSYEAVYVAANLGGALLILGVGSLLRDVFLAARTLLRHVPRGVWLGLASLVGGILLYPVTRSRVVNWVRKCADRWQVDKPRVVELLAELDHALVEMAASNAALQRNLENAQPVKDKSADLYHDVLRTLAQAPFALTIEEIVNRVPQVTRTESPTPQKLEKDILSILEESSNCAKDAHGRWSVKGIKYPEPKDSLRR